MASHFGVCVASLRRKTSFVATGCRNRFVQRRTSNPIEIPFTLVHWPSFLGEKNVPLWRLASLGGVRSNFGHRKTSFGTAGCRNRFAQRRTSNPARASEVYIKGQGKGWHHFNNNHRTNNIMEEEYISIDDVDRISVCILLTAAAVLLQHFFVRPPRRPQIPQRRQGAAARMARRRKIWCRDWLLRRHMHGQFDRLIQEMHREDSKGFKNFLRIEPGLFEEMVEKLTPLLRKQATKMRQPLQVGLKVACTLRFLATGDSYASLQYSFRVSKSAISRFIPIVCQAITDCYKEETLRCPTTSADWKKIANDFAKKWQYYNCLGSLDGKHIAIKKPRRGGSLYYNYKKFHSIVLMALADANYKFLYVDVGAEGSAGDAGTWAKCNLHDAIERNLLGIPESSPLPDDDNPVPFHFIGDDAFALRTWLMKPYSHQSQFHEEKIYSYRLSRARRVVENAFGLLSSRMRVFGTTMQLSPATVKIITMSACVLHNLILDRYGTPPTEVDAEDPEHNVIPGTWRETNELPGLERPRGQNYLRQAKALRDRLALYYSGLGAVPWQEQMVYPRGRPPV